MHVYEVLKRPIVTEKSNARADAYNQYTFEIDTRANKVQVKEAVEKAFNVTVLAVNIMRMPGKTRRAGRRTVRTPVWKKAVVKLAPGQRIEFFEGV
ncbi:MAG: 50S ribosomal protein L23 [Chloroflexi bacterium RBG_16_57_9]|nr:MAG: 50S ribosomal protein L23 [Chloroflexi bacterium RBG_16_57_9]